jgi:hypothetical protein
MSTSPTGAMEFFNSISRRRVLIGLFALCVTFRFPLHRISHPPHVLCPSSMQKYTTTTRQQFFFFG